MTNKSIIIEFVDGGQEYNAANHIGYQLNRLYNYSTLMCDIDRDSKTARVNTRKYSATTSRIQSIIRQVLTDRGYNITEFDGGACNYWNCGYMGATRYNKSDFAPVFR